MRARGRKRRSDHRDLTDLGEIAAQRLACLRRQLDEHAAAIVRIGAANEEAWLTMS